MATLQQQAWQFSCGPGCPFLVRSQTKGEVFLGALNHERLAHGGDRGEATLRKAIEAAPDA